MASKFYMPVSLDHTALLLSDVQTQILSRFSKDDQDAYLSKVKQILDFFRSEIECQRDERISNNSGSIDHHVPMIIHHILPFNNNSNAFISPYNKLAKSVGKVEASGVFADAPSDPQHPHYAIPEALVPPNGWGSKDEIVLGKLQPSCFRSSDLIAYLRARDIRHVVLVGLTTMGSILGSARVGADLDYHIICPQDAIMDDEPEVHEFLMKRILPKFIDVVDTEDILNLRTKTDIA